MPKHVRDRLPSRTLGSVVTLAIPRTSANRPACWEGAVAHALRQLYWDASPTVLTSRTDVLRNGQPLHCSHLLLIDRSAGSPSFAQHSARLLDRLRSSDRTSDASVDIYCGSSRRLHLEGTFRARSVLRAVSGGAMVAFL